MRGSAVKEEHRRERLEARISSEQKRLLQRAAEIRGLTLTDFVISSAQEAASVAVREEEVLTLRARDREAFVRALMHPPVPNQRLRSAVRRYRENRG
jgi:uncharacterized protein (DUF1778 family)